MWKNLTFLPVRMAAWPGQCGKTGRALPAPALAAGRKQHAPGLPHGPPTRGHMAMASSMGFALQIWVESWLSRVRGQVTSRASVSHL